MDVNKALAVLAESGIELPEELQTQLAEFKAATMRSEAETIFGRKLIRGDKESEKAFNTRVSDWTDQAFWIAESVSATIVGANVGRGRGEVHEKVFRVETPSGSLKVSLTTEPQSE